ncbi:cytochrome c peroxidase [Granulosicoccaceae sp. 1_MG-2023]|nr:cytochrome c peroxidase [Granulosicoccaceae sp. 1_MG-2023]
MLIKTLTPLLLLALSCLPAARAGGISKADLGRALFFDPALSASGTQSCATCHAPDKAFTDQRGSGVAAAVSLGGDGHSLGDRNAPTVTYAALIPDFHRKADGTYVGGLFLAGRAKDLAEQAGGPPLNPIEMAMADKAAVVSVLQKKPFYRDNLKALYGEAVFADSDSAYAAMTDAIAEFEREPEFATFDSRYDRFLRGEIELTPEEELGRTLFFSQQFTNCNICHQLSRSQTDPHETFSNYEYHNIGVPENRALRAINGMAGQRDEGLAANPMADSTDPGLRGRFRTPGLRNVAVTGPYMHNGVFKDLRTVVLFYNKYNSRAARRQINPETGEPWGEPEVAENLSLEELETGPALDDQRIDALVAFLRALTDARYEHLLSETEEAGEAGSTDTAEQ